MRKAFVNSLPKSGTNLLAKALQLAGYEDCGHIGAAAIRRSWLRALVMRAKAIPVRQGYLVGLGAPIEVSRRSVHGKLRHLKDGRFLTAHVGYTVDLLEEVLRRQIAPILVIRDPRAVVASWVPYVMSNRQFAFEESLARLPEEERYRMAIFGGRFTNGTYLQPLRVRCESLNIWRQCESVLTIRFEEIIGPSGGGTTEAQERELERLADFLSIPGDRLGHLARELFGPGRSTFRKGQVDSWRAEIPASVMEDLNVEMQPILSSWGYA